MNDRTFGKITNQVGTVIGVIIFLVLLIGILAGSFYAYRWFNWKFGYGPMVNEVMQKHIEEHHNDL